MFDCRTCNGSGAHPDCDGNGCNSCDPDTGNCPTCCGCGHDPIHWMKHR